MPDAVPASALTWKEFVAENQTFQRVYYDAIQLVLKLVQQTELGESDDAGRVLSTLMVATYPEFSDVMTLCSVDSHFGAQKILRCLFERAVTLKHIGRNPSEATAFLAFDAIDTESVISAIEENTTLRSDDAARAKLKTAAEEAKRNFKQERCPTCKLRKQTNWTPHSMQELAKRSNLSYLHMFAYLMPSKLIHATYYGTVQQVDISVSPLPNVTKAAHSLAIEVILSHQRYFHGEAPLNPDVEATVRAFYSVWKYSDTNFGLSSSLT